MRVALIDDAAVSRALFVRIARNLCHDVVTLPDPATDASARGPSAHVRPAHASSSSFDDRDCDLDALAKALQTNLPGIVILDGRFADPLGTLVDAPVRVARAVAMIRTAVPAARVGIVAALEETSLARAATDVACFVVLRPYLRSQIGAMLAALANDCEAPLR